MRYLLANGQYLRIREVALDDAAALLDMFCKAVNETDFLMTTPAEAERLTLAHEREFITSYKNNDNNLFLVADVEKTLVGSLSITRPAALKQQHTGEFGIVVLQKYWNMGIARRMITAMLQWAENNEIIHYLYLSVMAGNEKAIRLYRNFGFTEEGRRPGFVRQADHLFQDVIIMGKWVKQERG
jgi:RimJ/RimL family protein N-acetyltransferase